MVEIPEALPPEELDRAKAAESNEKKIHLGVENQERMLDTIAEEAAALQDNPNDDMRAVPLSHLDLDDLIIFSEASMDELEAPVIYLTPPVVLPDEQMEADTEVEKILIDTGLEKKPERVDPFRLTSLNEVNTALKMCKSAIDSLRQKRNSLMKNIRESAAQMATDHSKHATYKAQNQELLEVEKHLDDELARLLKLEHVKKSLAKKHGAGHDVEDAEEELEERESELAEASVEEEDDAVENDDVMDDDSDSVSQEDEL
ncbi:uncharacterized protein BXIN_0557 [Babesia sp. Xinjiang]|uniref:uncharacterized protein n=1 Tax=Babesia sp. Xinjiang TaxID=462227 RepID=UPI000A25D3AB|nr:uncharacterized protein BXIN_0557 [Babesia sp. Xinjiang]ORM41837.1 hypothetical protein BXIN_0557 [Babesia sp. Xinjiang]